MDDIRIGSGTLRTGGSMAPGASPDRWYIAVYHEANMHEPAHTHAADTAYAAISAIEAYPVSEYPGTRFHVECPAGATAEEIETIREMLALRAMSAGNAEGV